jgi:hypothetical protein
MALVPIRAAAQVAGFAHLATIRHIGKIAVRLV